MPTDGCMEVSGHMIQAAQPSSEDRNLLKSVDVSQKPWPTKIMFRYVLRNRVFLSHSKFQGLAPWATMGCHDGRDPVTFAL